MAIWVHCRAVLPWPCLQPWSRLCVCACVRVCASACAGGEGGWQKIALLGGESLRRVFIASPASQESSPPAPDTPAQTGEKTVLGRGPEVSAEGKGPRC